MVSTTVETDPQLRRLDAVSLIPAYYTLSVLVKLSQNIAVSKHICQQNPSGNHTGWPRKLTVPTCYYQEQQKKENYSKKQRLC